MSDKVVFRIVLAISIVVLLLVVVLNMKIIPRPDVPPEFVKHFPFFNAIINGTCSVLLLLSLYQIKRKNISAHKKLNITAFILSSVFLIFYVTYHYLMNETKFGDLNHDGVLDATEQSSAGISRIIYLFILLSHIFLAAIVLPLILLSFYWGLKNEVVKHRKIVRFSYPIWLYVTVTGVVVYTMISPYYPF